MAGTRMSDMWLCDPKRLSSNATSQVGAEVMPYQDSIRPEALTDTHFPPQNESSEMKFEILIPIVLFAAFYTTLTIFFPRRNFRENFPWKLEGFFAGPRRHTHLYRYIIKLYLIIYNYNYIYILIYKYHLVSETAGTALKIAFFGSGGVFFLDLGLVPIYLF